MKYAIAALDTLDFLKAQISAPTHGLVICVRTLYVYSDSTHILVMLCAAVAYFALLHMALLNGRRDRQFDVLYDMIAYIRFLLVKCFANCHVLIHRLQDAVSVFHYVLLTDITVFLRTLVLFTVCSLYCH